MLIVTVIVRLTLSSFLHRCFYHALPLVLLVLDRLHLTVFHLVQLTDTHSAVVECVQWSLDPAVALTQIRYAFAQVCYLNLLVRSCKPYVASINLGYRDIDEEVSHAVLP